jgi:hypothetical protein
MPRGKNNGNGQLHESLTAMQQAQANMLQTLATVMLRLAQIDADIANTNKINSERFARIETLLAEHSQVLAALPEKIEELFAEQSNKTLKKFGFQPPAKE